MGAALGDRSEQQFGAKSPAGEVSRDGSPRFLGGGAGVEENDDRWAGATESRTEDASFPGQFLQAGEQGAERRAVRLVDAVFECGGEQMVVPLREGSQQEHRVLDVSDGVGTGIFRRENTTGFFRGHGLVWDGQEQRPLPFRSNADHLGSCLPGHTSDGKTAHPAGGCVIGMVLAAGGFSDNLGIRPLQTAEVIGQSNAGEAGGGRRTTAFADWDLVVYTKRQRSNFPALSLEHLGVGCED